ncbi:ATP-binding cassette domain-containing protein [Amycolatopsis pigmentata]|uniref:ATP-binding cassette domain-containing protein n=1 Tax=Amycolatopsis pigmentata TaxID=450801 RepID=A0ABW5GBU8_9PSEU
MGGPFLELVDVGKSYGTVTALRGVGLAVRAAEVTCVLGDNGAGKSTLINIISGRHAHDTGQYSVDGEQVRFSSPREALDRGIATVYQDLAVVPLMPVWRNFFLGSEPVTGVWPFRRLDVATMRETTVAELKKMGITLPDVDQPIGSLSGGQRQCVAIARAVYFGARVLVLDEPTAALGVKQSGVVLSYIAAARDAGLGVVFVTHNPRQAFLAGDHFVVLHHGEVELDVSREGLSLDDLAHHMAGGSELDALERELERGRDPAGLTGTSGEGQAGMRRIPGAPE